MNKRTSRRCWRKDACRKVDCKFNHSPQYCWQKDACVKDDCKFIHPRDGNIQGCSGDNVLKCESNGSLQSLNANALIKDPIEGGPTSGNLNEGRSTQQNDLTNIGFCIDEENESSTNSVQIQSHSIRSIPTKVFYSKGTQIGSTDNLRTKQIQSDRKVNDAATAQQQLPITLANTNTNASRKQRKRLSGQKETSVKSGQILSGADSQRKGSTSAGLHEATDTSATKQSEEKNSAKRKSKMERFVPVPVQSTDARDSSAQLYEVVHVQKENSTQSVTVNSGRKSSSHPGNMQQRGLDKKSYAFVPSNGPITPIEPEWNRDETKTLVQHRQIIENIKDKISSTILSEDYCTNYEKNEASIRILRDSLIELESHVPIFDSVKSRACRELSSRPTELRNQVFREIYRLKCRLGAFAKRLDMEKYFGGGDRFLIVQGQTGSGKSTQIPQYVADHPRFYGKKVICTQPRKLAAISLSRRVAFEYSCGIERNSSASYIAYQVGGDKRENRGCRIEFVTEGIMLERIMKGSMEPFKDVGCIIVDEAHERSITCDLLLGSFRKPDPRWKDILIIVTSATINLTLFSHFFNDAPTVQIEGRTFPVDIIYQPSIDESELQTTVAECALQIHLNCRKASGDILCFLPGLDDITNTKSTFERELRKVASKTSGLLEARVFMLYGKQEPDKQAEVFEKLDSSTKRKIIFATDIAETSITIDGVVYVVDSGVKKEIVFDSVRNISSLKINPISKSSAIQRAGRCGRTQPGVCYRLYSQDEFESMNINASPEVLCKPISLAVLTLLELSLDPENFDWISPPSTEAISNAQKELTILGAVDSHSKPTELGNLIAKCQQDPKMMKIVYSGCVRGLGEAACSVASILSVSNMFFWNGNDAESKAKALEMRKNFATPEGDIVTMYRIFEEFNSTYNGRQKRQSADSEDKIVRKSASAWCNDNSLNAKSMFMALTTKAELMNQLKRTKIWSKSRDQNKLATNCDIQELMCSGYFIQCARVFYSKRNNAPVEYFSVESAVTGRLDFRSSLNLLDIEPPKWIVYDKIVRLPNTIFPVASVMDENWLKETNFDFYKKCLRATEDLPTDLIKVSISQVSFRMIVGRNFCNVDALEKELGCLVTGDADTGIMHLYCAPVKSLKVEQEIRSKIEDVLDEIRNQVVEETYLGNTRVVIGEGYEVHEVLFEKEFSTFYVKDVNAETDKCSLEYLLTVNKERLASLDCTHHGKTYTAVAKFKSKKDARSAYDRLSSAYPMTLTPSFGVGNVVRQGLYCRLKLTWPTARSKGVAHIFFKEPDDANRFLDNVQYIYPNAVVHVSGETQRNKQRNAQLKFHGLRPSVVQAPLNYLQLPKYSRSSQFRYDLATIADMPDKHQLKYKVTLASLIPSVDKTELTTKLAVYGLKNVIVEYENFIVPDSGNGLSAEEKIVRLEPLRRFMDANTMTTDFFNPKTGTAVIYIDFTSNSIAKKAYNYAKAKYDSTRSDPLLGPHRLDIECTLTISILIGLYTFLRPQIEALQKEARTKHITCSTTSIQDNSKKIILKFKTEKHSLLDWIQEQLDELVRPTKFDCPHSDVLFKWTGRLEVMKFAKKTYINMSDDSHIIWVYGSAEQKDKSCKEIEKIANHLHSLDVLDKEIWLNKTVRINGKEGRAITNKCEEAKIAFSRFHGNRIYISGSQKAVDIVSDYLAQQKFSWNRSKGNRFKLDENRECGLCTMPPDSTFIMLSVCGHLFCSDCIEPMLKLQPPPFPIKCPICDEHVALYDIKKLAPTKSLEKVLELAVKLFQQNNSHDIRKCPKPGCHQLLYYEQRIAGTNGGDFLFCDDCLISYCITCSETMEKPVRSHDDDSCASIQSGVANLVNKHVRVIRDTVFNLSCPNCNTAFYDFSHCAAVTCRTCKAGFCGLCLADCGRDAHEHVRSCSINPSGRLFLSDRDLQAAHVEMRNQKLREYLSHNRLNIEVQQQIVEKIKTDLVDLKMTVPVISADPYDKAATETSVAIMRYVRKIQETILTLSCPNCDAAFFDFDGCAAVSCYSCRMEFCGLCLDYTSSSVVTHVVRCYRNSMKGNYFLNSDELTKIHASVRADKIQTYFDDKLKDVDTKEKVLAVIRADLLDLQIKLPDINVRRRVRPPSPVRFQRMDDLQQRRDFIRQAIPAREPFLQAIPVMRPAAQPARRECCIL